MNVSAANNSLGAAEPIDLRALLLDGLTPEEQAPAVRSVARRTLVIAGAGSGKTEVMARRVAWWVAVEEVEKSRIVAFTFTDRGAEEMKFRIRDWIQRITPPGHDPTLGGMYVGTIHGFAIKMLRDLVPDRYHTHEILDDIGRISLIQAHYHGTLGLPGLQAALGAGMYATIEQFLVGYDLLNEYGELEVELPAGNPPHRIEDEAEWCRGATLRTNVGTGPIALAFATVAARYYALLHCRRFLDFSTSQMELATVLTGSPERLAEVRRQINHIVVDEVQDVNPVQDRLARLIVGETGHLTAVGDHRQAIFGWRGGRVDIMADLHAELIADHDGEVLELTRNFRSTPQVIDLSNSWAGTIQAPGTLPNPAMRHGRAARTDYDQTHVGALRFASRQDEAQWIAQTVTRLIRPPAEGARHDAGPEDRGLTYSDVVVLVRSTTDARSYMAALRDAGVPVVFRAGPDLFSQPEVLLTLAGISLMAGLDQFVGNPADTRSMAGRIQTTLGSGPDPKDVVRAACAVLRAEGLTLDPDVEERILTGCLGIAARTQGVPLADPAAVVRLHSPALRAWLRRATPVRRVFPQTLLHLLLEEMGIDQWDDELARSGAAMYHLGQLSRLMTGVEMPGWTSAQGFRYRVIALMLWGTRAARSEEAPLLAAPQAVTISTIHAIKGLEFPVVFLADVCARRFPSSRARTIRALPFDGPILGRINPALLADDANLNAERRLVYVALTRAERYLFVSASGVQQSAFFAQLTPQFAAAGGATGRAPADMPTNLEYRTPQVRRDIRLVSSFSDLRYYLECPHDFYLRKVLGFAPTIDQAFGYGRGIHNILRAVHTDPRTWAALADDRDALEAALEAAVASGLFYLRYTTGEPADNMRRRAVKVIADYIEIYRDELERLTFEPEREFETLLEDEKVLISGAIDVVRLDDPPRVSIIDFKSGEPTSDGHALDEGEMRLQVTMYGLAAKHELEFEPERGLVRYLGSDDPDARELQVDLDDAALADAREVIRRTATGIRDRAFFTGPVTDRCSGCDFLPICGQPSAAAARAAR